MEIEGWERLCLAKDKLIEEKNAEQRQMIEQVRQRLEEIGTDPQLLQVIAYSYYNVHLNSELFLVPYTNRSNLTKVASK